MTASTGLAAALPQYVIGSCIGSGGMGEVYGGMHRSLGREVAIKRLPSDLTGDPDINVRFDREARVLASLDHPHIVPVYDYVQTGRDNLLVMEKLTGGTVYDRFYASGLSPEQSCAITLATLSGLHAAHRAGVLHLDVKPKNLLFTSAGVLKVADFGIAQVISDGATLVSHGGNVLGTPAYLAPEQAMGDPLTPAADVYAAGTVLYELLCGELPFDRTQGAMSLVRQRMFTDPAPLRGIPAPLAPVVMRSIARELPQRYREAEAFAIDLAAAATAVFGPGWLERSHVPVHLSPRVLSGTTRTVSTADTPTVLSEPVRGRAPEPTRMYQDLRGLRPVSEALRKPGPSPLVPGLLALVTLAVLLVLPFLAPRTVSHPDAGTGIAVDGQPATAVVEADLSRPVTVTAPAGTGGPVRFGIEAAGVRLGEVTTEAGTSADGSLQATLPPPALLRWLVGGAATGSVRIGDGEPQRFTLVTSQHPMASAMGAGSLLLGLFALAYLESLMRALRRGQRRPSAPVVAVPIGALLGGAVWLLAAALTTREPVAAYGVGCVVAGAAGAMLLVLTTSFAARRR